MHRPRVYLAQIKVRLILMDDRAAVVVLPVMFRTVSLVHVYRKRLAAQVRNVVWTSNNEPQTSEGVCQQVHVCSKLDASIGRWVWK